MPAGQPVVLGTRSIDTTPRDRVDLANGMPEAASQRLSSIQRGERLLGERRPRSQGRQRFLRTGSQLSRARAGDMAAKARVVPASSCWGPGNSAARAERVKAEAEHADPAGGPQHELARQLSGEHQHRLDRS